VGCEVCLQLAVVHVLRPTGPSAALSGAEIVDAAALVLEEATVVLRILEVVLAMAFAAVLLPELCLRQVKVLGEQQAILCCHVDVSM
jgi:hypothetical protein